MDKKLLIISYHFPPSPEVGGLRAANFTKHFPSVGWSPCVLTLRDEYLETFDAGKLERAGQAKVWKAGRMPTLSPLYVKIKKTFQRWLRISDKPARVAESRQNRAHSACREALSSKLRRYVLSFWCLPDEHRSWVLPALILAIRLIRREKIDCIMTSSPPYSVHLVGWLAKLFTGVRWIADFRDPWMTGGSKTLYATCAASLRIERWLEQRVVAKADLVVANTDKLYREFRKTYGRLPDHRFIHIANGFDKEFFAGFDGIGKAPIFTIIYTGTLYFGRTPEPVFQAVQELIREGRIDPPAIKIRLVGNCRFLDGRSIAEVIQHYALGDVVEVLDAVPYRRAIEMVKESHVALLLAPDQPYQIPAKAYDYMGVGTSVLALAEEGATSDLVRSTGIGAAFRPNDIAGIKIFILQSMGREVAPVRKGPSPAIETYEIRNVVQTLARRLDQLCSQISCFGTPASRQPQGGSQMFLKTSMKRHSDAVSGSDIET